MRLTELDIKGAFVVEPEAHVDERGFFARTWCAREFASHGLASQMVQANVSYNRRAGTLRGLHLQRPPAAEAKLVRAIRGRLWDVVLDLRPESPTFLGHVSVELFAGGDAMVYVPAGCAHGFQTLEDDTEVLYLMSDYHAPEHATGVRWNDGAFGIRWPLPSHTISLRDRSYPDFDGAAWRG